MGTCRSARLASWEVAAVSESPRLMLGNLVQIAGIRPRNRVRLQRVQPETQDKFRLTARGKMLVTAAFQRPVTNVPFMPETGRRPVSRMHRHEPQSLALRAAAGLSTGVECLKTPWGFDDEEPRRRAAPAQPLAPAGTRPIHPRPGGRRAFGHDCSALVTRVGEALDHGEDYKEQLQANRVQPLSPPSPEPLAAPRAPTPVAASAHPKRAAIGHQPLLAVAQPKPSAARRPPPFAVDSSYDARPSSAREPRHLPVSHGPRSPPRPEPDATKHTILEATRKLKEAGVSTRDSPVRHHRLG